MTKFLDEKVSVFHHSWKSVWPLRDFLLNETFGDRDRQSIVEEYRQAYRADDKVGKRIRRCYSSSLTNKIPCCTISGIFRKQGRRYDLKTHSGLICISINAEDNPGLNMASVRQELIRMVPQILYISLSAEGDGLIVIIRLQYPDKHRSQVKQLAEDFKAMNIIIDEQWNYENRFCPLTYDPDPYIRQGKEIPYAKLFDEDEDDL